jgi:DNA-binding XRE family transcriptional regulator
LEQEASEVTKTNFDKYLEEQLEDPEFAEGFERAGREWDLALQIARQREEAGLTQLQLAERVGTTQQQISRLERPGYKGSLRTIERVAAALGACLEVRLSAPRVAKAPSARSKSRGKSSVHAGTSRVSVPRGTEGAKRK